MVAKRTKQNAPYEVRQCGGVAMSLWLSGACHTDCKIVARMNAEVDRLRGAVDAEQADFPERIQIGLPDVGGRFLGPFDADMKNGRPDLRMAVYVRADLAHDAVRLRRTRGLDEGPER